MIIPLILLLPPFIPLPRKSERIAGRHIHKLLKHCRV